MSLAINFVNRIRTQLFLLSASVVLRLNLPDLV